MKNFKLFINSILLFTAITLLSCKKKYDIKGCWNYDSSTSFEIKDDGVLIQINPLLYPKFTQRGSWSLSENKLILKWDNENNTSVTQIYTIEKVETNNMILKYADVNEIVWTKTDCK